MDKILNEVEVRVLGSLVEKQVTTPEYYPLTLNALLHACNQLSNREPVVSYDEKTIAFALETLREKNLAYVFYGSDSRVPKYKQMMTEVFHLSAAELALMCVLMLRGPQTVGELRGRTGRLYDFADLAEVESTLDQLISKEDAALVVKLPRQAGRKEARYAHLLQGQVEVPVEPERVITPEPVMREVRGENEKMQALQTEVEMLRNEVADLRHQFEQFKKQFE